MPLNASGKTGRLTGNAVAPLGGGELGKVGLARIISDCATYAYLCDVSVLEAHREHGLAKAMMTLTIDLPQLQELRRWNLVTRDAHGLCAQFGFVTLARPSGYLERLTPEIYRPSRTE